MTALDRQILAERAAAVERHLARVAARMPAPPGRLEPSADATDAVILHLWQAVQVVLDVAIGSCVKRNLGTPASYADAFQRLTAAGLLDAPLAERLVKAAGFRDVVAHAYESIDLARVEDAARHGPSDLRAFLATVRDLL